MRTKTIKSEEEKKQDEYKKRNYNRYYYHLVRKNKNKNEPDIKNISKTVVNIEYGNFSIIF